MSVWEKRIRDTEEKTIPECEERDCARLVRRTRICSASSRKRQTRTAAWPLAKGILKLAIEARPQPSDGILCSKPPIYFLLPSSSSSTPLGFSIHRQKGCFFFFFFFFFCCSQRRQKDQNSREDRQTEQIHDGLLLF